MKNPKVMTKAIQNHRRKKLAVLITLPSLGGLELNLLKLFSYLYRKNGPTEVCLIVSKNSASEKWAQREDLPYISLSQPKKYFSIPQIFELKKIVLEHEITDFILSTSQDLDLLAWLKLLPASSKPLRLYFYQQMQIGVDKKNFYHSWKFSKIDYWISPLPWLKTEILEKTSVPEYKITIMPLCMDTHSFCNALTSLNQMQLKQSFHLLENSIAIGIIGRIDPGKGQLQVLEAFKQVLGSLSGNHKNIHLFIIGSPTINDKVAEEYGKALEVKIHEWHLEKFVTLVKHSHNPVSFYCLLDILIVASERETFGMVTVEGLLANLAIIGSNTGGTREILEQGELGLLYDQKDTKDLVRKTQQMIEENERYKDLLKSRDFKTQYDFERLEKFICSDSNSLESHA